MSLSVLIVEDEAIIADDISFCLEQNGYTIEGIADSYDTAVQLLETKQPDIVLLDIMIKGDKTGLDIGALLHNHYHLPFLYLTSLFDTKTVSQANTTHPVGYVVKPYNEADLLVGIQMGWKKHRLTLNHVKAESKPIFVRKDGGLSPLNPDDIYFAEASDNYTYLHTSDEKYVVSQTLKAIEDQLDKKTFCRIHKSYLVNLTKIELIEHSVVFILGKPLPIGKVYRKSLMDSLTIL
jgi:two-component system response regulator LytT